MSRFLTALPFVLLLAAACTYLGGRTEPYRPSGIQAKGGADTGQELYQRDCAWCHGDAGEGTPRGPDIVSGDEDGPALVDFMLTTGRMPIEYPEQPARRGPALYSAQETAMVVEYVRRLGADGPDVPHPRPERGDIAMGEVLYQQNCAACHSTTGIGGTLTLGRSGDTGGEVARRSETIVPGLHAADAREIEEAMVTGPGTMPVLGEETFTPREIDSIVRYVLYLRDPVNRGGADLGRVGPVVEGAVAWVVALGAMLVLARWIGSRVERE